MLIHQRLKQSLENQTTTEGNIFTFTFYKYLTWSMILITRQFANNVEKQSNNEPAL